MANGACRNSKSIGWPATRIPNQCESVIPLPRNFSSTFTEYYGRDALDVHLLMLPMIWFLPVEDERVRNTIAAIERDLLVQGFVLGYRPEEENVGVLPGDEGVFLPCSFWFATCLHWLGRK